MRLKKDLQILKFAAYGFLKNLRFFDPFIILFFKELQISYFQIGILYSFREFSTAILEVPTGWVADSWGRKYSLMFSFLSYIMTFLIFFFFRSFQIFFIAMFLYSLGDALRSGTHKAIIMCYLKENNLSDKKVYYYGFTRSWSQRGSAISAIIAAIILIFFKSYRYVFLASIIPYLLDFFLIASYPNYLNGVHLKSKGKFHFYVNFRKTLSDFFKIFTKKNIIAIFLNSSVYDGLYKAVKDYLQPIIKSYALLLPIVILKDRDNSFILISLIYFILYMLSAYSSQYSYLIKKAMGKTDKAVNFTYLFGIFSLFTASFFYLINLKILTIIFFIIFYMVQNMRRPLIVEIISNNIKGSVLASGLSAESLLKMLTTIFFSLIAGFLADSFGIGVALVMISIPSIFLIFLFKLK